jgi:hypothetical protein
VHFKLVCEFAVADLLQFEPKTACSQSSSLNCGTDGPRREFHVAQSPHRGRKSAPETKYQITSGGRTKCRFRPTLPGVHTRTGRWRQLEAHGATAGRRGLRTDGVGALTPEHHRRGVERGARALSDARPATDSSLSQIEYSAHGRRNMRGRGSFLVFALRFCARTQAENKSQGCVSRGGHVGCARARRRKLSNVSFVNVLKATK